MTDEDFVADALVQWEEAFETGHDIPSAELCRDRPALADRVADGILALRAFSHVCNSDLGPCLIPESGWNAGDVIAGQFRLEEWAGRGAHAEVWRGTDLQTDRTIAVKLPWVGSADRILAAEAFRATNLTHPHIVPVYYTGRDETTYYIVSHFIDRETLAARIGRDRPDIPEAVRIAGDIAAALAYAHGRGVVHRDVKPENVLLGRKGRVFVTDFSIAIGLGERGRPRSGSSGTPPYMAPEQYNAAAELDERCDVYAVGVILYEMLTGRHPFPMEDGAAQLAKLAGREPERPSAVNPDVTSDLDEIVARCLADDPGDRFGSAEDLLVALGGDTTPLRLPSARALAEGSWVKRMEQLRRLRRAGRVPHRTLRAVVELLRTDILSHREEVTAVLVGEGAAAVTALAAALTAPARSDDDEFRRTVITVLERIGPAAADAIHDLRSAAAKTPSLSGAVDRALALIHPPRRRWGRSVAAVAVVALAALGIVAFLLFPEDVAAAEAPPVKPDTAALAVVVVVAVTLGLGLAAVQPPLWKPQLLVVVVALAVGTEFGSHLATLWMAVGAELDGATSPRGK